jgi:hypothetical protein
METAGNPVIIDAFRKSGVASLHHLRGNVGVEERAGAKRSPDTGVRGFSGSKVEEPMRIEG